RFLLAENRVDGLSDLTPSLRLLDQAGQEACQVGARVRLCHQLTVGCYGFTHLFSPANWDRARGTPLGWEVAPIRPIYGYPWTEPARSGVGRHSRLPGPP